MKTAMQELLEWHRLSMRSYSETNKMIEALLEKEKEQITKAWDDGDYAYFYNKETGRDFENGEEYYNQTYNQNK
jgi:hypothetical protein